MAITKWIHYADHALAPICRSRDGSNMPIADTNSAGNSDDIDKASQYLRQV